MSSPVQKVWNMPAVGAVNNERVTIEALIKDPLLQSRLALDGDPITSLDEMMVFSGNPTNIDTLFARDGNIGTKREMDRAFDGNVVTQTLRDIAEDYKDHKLSSKLPSPWDQPPTPFDKNKR